MGGISPPRARCSTASETLLSDSGKPVNRQPAPNEASRTECGQRAGRASCSPDPRPGRGVGGQRGRAPARGELWLHQGSVGLGNTRPPHQSPLTPPGPRSLLLQGSRDCGARGDTPLPVLRLAAAAKVSPASQGPALAPSRGTAPATLCGEYPGWGMGGVHGCECAWMCGGGGAPGSRGSYIPGCHLPAAPPRGQLPERGPPRTGQPSPAGSARRQRRLTRPPPAAPR